MQCLLCNSLNTLKNEETFQCSNCSLLFKNPTLFLSFKEESKRYSSHENDRLDQGYRDFLSRLISPLKMYLPKKFEALDFGCGPGPTLNELLEEVGGRVLNYDPLFFPNDEVLIEKQYDVVTSTEVVEHFKDPHKSWKLLTSLVKPGGLLAIMTQMYSEETDYKSWWYKNDPTHVVFYQSKTFDYIAKTFNHEVIYQDSKSIIILKRRAP